MIDLDQNEINKPAVAAALRELEGEGGTLTPEQVLTAARSSNSPLHHCGFEWDASKAQTKFNLEVARSLIRTVRYRVTTVDHGVIKVPVYVRDPNAPQKTQGYISLRNVVRKSPAAHAIIANEMDQCLSHLNRAMAIGLALGYGDPIGQLIEDATAFRARVEGDAENLQPA